MKTFVSASSYFRKEYGGKVYKIALSADTTCPNRDGSKGNGGCIFCSDSGSGDFAYPGLPVREQLVKAKALVEAKIKGPEKRYIAYFQNFTNTYGERTRLEALFEEAVADDEVVGLSIATRPDCLGEDILSMLSSLSRKTKLIVELGLQTSNEETGRLINRAYSNDDYIEAMKKLKTIDCHTITHVIFGLPGETGEDMMNTVRFVSENKSDGIKISTLHVLRGTRLETLYNEGAFEALKMDEYFNLVTKALKILPESMVIHRLTGDGAKRILIAPMWTADKKKVMNSLKAALEREELFVR